MHSAILLNFIKLPFVIKIFVLSIFEWPFYTGFTVYTIDKFFQQIIYYVPLGKGFWDVDPVCISVGIMFSCVH